MTDKMYSYIVFTMTLVKYSQMKVRIEIVRILLILFNMIQCYIDILLINNCIKSLSIREIIVNAYVTWIFTGRKSSSKNDNDKQAIYIYFSNIPMDSDLKITIIKNLSIYILVNLVLKSISLKLSEVITVEHIYIYISVSTNVTLTTLEKVEEAMHARLNFFTIYFP